MISRFILSGLVALIFVGQVASLSLAQPRSRLFFDGLTCSTCEGVMSVVSKQIPNAAGVGKDALKLAVKGACAYYTLGIPIAIPLCTAMSGKLVDILADDILGRTMSVIPKSNCRTAGMCPPCNIENKKFVMAREEPKLPLPWDHHNKHEHLQMVSRVKAEEAEKRRRHAHAVALNHTQLSPARQKAIFDTMSCYGCKSIMGMVGHDVTNVKQAGKDVLISAVKTSCKAYISGIPFSEQICTKITDQMTGLTADVMGKAEIRPAENCRAIKMCPPCPNGKCDDEEEIQKGKEAAKAGQTPLPDKDGGCDEPPVNRGLPCTDNSPKCTSSKVTCDSPMYERMLRMECMFTCVCSWLPWFKG